MKTSATYLFFLLAFVVLSIQPAWAFVLAPAHPTAPATLTVDEVLQLQPAEMEQRLGRKLSWRERMGSKIMQRQARRAAAVNDSGEMDGLAIAGFVCGVVGIVYAGFILGLLGIIFSAIALGRMKRTGKGGRSLAIAGLVCGIVGLVGWTIIVIAISA